MVDAIIATLKEEKALEKLATLELELRFREVELTWDKEVNKKPPKPLKPKNPKSPDYPTALESMS